MSPARPPNIESWVAEARAHLRASRGDRAPGNHTPTTNPAAQPAQGGLDARGGGNLPGRAVTGSGGRIRRPAMALTDFLLARIAEDEAVARACVGPEWQSGLPATTHPDPTTYRTVVRKVGHVCGSIIAADAEHIARHDPARVLAKCAADRRILAVLTNGGQLSWERMAAANREILLDLASVYEGHRDYRDEWRSES